MPDPIQPNTPTPITPADPVAPVLPSPQEMVDAALSGDVGVSTTAKSMQNPQSESLPNLPSIEPSIVKSPESVIAQPSPSTTPKEPIMSDDTPLAFATNQINNPVTPKNIVTPNSPVSEGKPDKRKLIRGVISIIVILISLGGGMWGYQTYQNSKNPASINITSEEREAQDIITKGGSQVVKVPNKTKDFAKEKGIKVPDTAQLWQVTLFNETGDPNVFNQSVIEATKVVKDSIKKTNEQVYGIGKAVTDQSQCETLKRTNWDINKMGNVDSPDGAGNSEICSNGKCTAPPGCRVEKVTCNAGGQVGVPCNETVVSSGPTAEVDKNITCGSQQLDVYCDVCKGGPIAFTNKITGINCKTNNSNEPSSKPSPSPVVTMACTGLTYTPSTAPVIGDKLVFTCAGTVTPSTAGTLSYKFRYSINGGTPVALTNLVATPTKAELTINSCGTYKVECQACATIAGVLKCDPTWIGATQ